ncbi:ATP-binding cassette domain-containing protein [Elizabethkingia argentiflava]|uniref:ATP-binding cassette domain-containing protein n=1 Tax=Elizabethkingia argenteiflava TaxID=2681556 RepID=A0A845PTD0_9FLAO|nr:ABC transporter ATP-binding protein [Elizabethkingia argenteiflava]NAW50291.1 ATP-binding cassette domain-containing protein [Elizabethkingia argenteiflava]
MLLEIKGLDFSYPSQPLIFQNFHLDLKQGKIMALIGESGCGKSTLLNIIYGRKNWQQGRIFFDNKEIYGPKANIVPGEADMKLVSQDYDLMPYSKVYDNVGKFISNINLENKKNKILELLDIVGLTDYLYEYPKNLSGGQQQRVAIAQALSQLPKLLLLDEPFSHLDLLRKQQIRDKLFNYVRTQNISLIISTHDVNEVLAWSDEVVVLKKGQVIQRDAPKVLFQSPKTPYVAQLLGEVNILTPAQQRELNLSKWFYFPHQLLLTDHETHNPIQGEVISSSFSGSFYRNIVKVKNHHLIVYTSKEKKGKLNVKFN